MANQAVANVSPLSFPAGGERVELPRPAGDPVYALLEATHSHWWENSTMVAPKRPDPDADPFRPPEIPTEVRCLHCGEEYDSYRIEWREETGDDGRVQGFWCCPTPGCGGMGFGFDILPTDPTYCDQRGGWVSFNEDEDEDEYGEYDEDYDECGLDPDDDLDMLPPDDDVLGDLGDEDIPF